MFHLVVYKRECPSFIYSYMIRHFHGGKYWTNPVFFAMDEEPRPATQEDMDAMPWHLYTEAMCMEKRVVFHANFSDLSRRKDREIYAFRNRFWTNTRFRPKLRMDRDLSYEKITAFAMGMHHRLGAAAKNKDCSSDVLRMIADFCDQ